MKLAANGDVRIEMPGGGEVIHHAPVIYQERGGRREKIAGHAVLRGADTIGFKLAAYDHSRPLAIDPGLVYSTFLGGNGDHGDGIEGIAVDSSGNAYVTGFTQSISNSQCTAAGTPDPCCTGAGAGTCIPFPTTAGVFQGMTRSPVGINAFVTKFTADGSGLVYSTHLGGSKRGDGVLMGADTPERSQLTHRATPSLPDRPNPPISPPPRALFRPFRRIPITWPKRMHLLPS